MYPDNQPRNLEIAALQKGLVLLLKGVELIEEGAGFGVPIVKYEDCTFFSGSAQAYVNWRSENEVVLSKIFFLDAVSRKQIHSAYVNEGFYSAFHKTFEKVYLKSGRSTGVFDWVMQLRKTLGVHTRFVNATSKGKVTVTYHCFPDKIDVHVNLRDLEQVGCREILLLNEQGATTFRRTLDSEAGALRDRQIGAWAKVTGAKAAFSDLHGKVWFGLETKPGAELYRGREQIKDRFSWAGMTYALKPSTLNFQYTIKVGARV